MDREHLVHWSLELADEAFAPALAALGVLAAIPRARVAEAFGPDGWRIDALAPMFAKAIDGPRSVLRWDVPVVAARSAAPRIRLDIEGKSRSVDAPDARTLAGVWRDFIAHFPRASHRDPAGPRLALHTTSGTVGPAMALVPALSRTEVGAASVFLDEMFASDGRTDWRWPFTLATLPGDRLAEPLAALQSQFPPSWPFRYATASRDDPRIEILVIGAGVSDALSLLLASGLRLRCCLVVVAGLGTDSPRTAEPLLRALVARTSAEGVAVLDSGRSPQQFAERLNGFAYELTHNKTLDVALMEAFQGGALLLLNRDLLALSHLDATVGRMAQRLRRLPRDSEVLLTKPSSDLIGLPSASMRAPTPRMTSRAAPPGPSAAATPADVAAAIDEARSTYRFESEAAEASAISELSRSVADAESEAARRAAVPRHVQQKSFRKQDGRFVEERSGYVVGQPVMVQVFIGPKRDDSIAAPTAFPEHKLPKNRDAHRLQVVFHEPRQFDRPMLGEIVLPRQGDSSPAEFVFAPRAQGRFEGRISVLHRGRVLQTVLLRTQVAREPRQGPDTAPGISLADEAHVRHDWSDLGKRRQFDLALVLNHTPAGDAVLTGITGQRAWATNLDGIEQPVRKLNELISAVAHSVADYGDGLDQGENPQLLVKLARVGANLYSLLYKDQLKALATDDFDVGDASVTYLQVVSARPDAVVPLEFMYDFNAPDPAATVCPQHREALSKGRCPDNCARTAQPRAHVCPLGFWGLKKVIERHIFDAKAAKPAGAEVVVQVEAIEGRDRLDLGDGALVGHSQEVKAAEVADLVKALGATLGSAVPVVKDWDEWMATVKQSHPALLVAFPHNEGKEEDVLLEIGGKKLLTLDLPRDYVRTSGGSPPVVFLLGCDVAGTAQDFSSHIRYFRQAGAAVVVSTIATVFGAHAVRVGQAIVDRLAKTGETGKARIGEAIRDAKRQALLDSVPMALCVVAFGDADWRL